MRQLLSLGQTELLVNLMWFGLNMDLSNPLVQGKVESREVWGIGKAG